MAKKNIIVDKATNGDLIILRGLPDGSWTAMGKRYGNFVEVREAGPETALQSLLTHP